MGVQVQAEFLVTMVAQYCKLEAAVEVIEVTEAAMGNTRSLACRSRLVTVTISKLGLDPWACVPGPCPVGVIETELDVSCSFRFRERVMGPILVMETEFDPAPTFMKAAAAGISW